MLHSSWDMETYARTHQDERMREAEKARLLEMAGLGWGSWIPALGLRIRDAVSSAQTRLAGRRPAPLTRPATVAQAPAPMTPVTATLEVRREPRPRAVRAAEPYAAMVVVARSAVSVSERPCGVGDR